MDDRFGSRGGETFGQILVGVTAAGESDNGHAGCPGGFDAEDGILDHDAACRLHPETLRRQKKEIRRGLSVGDLDRAEDVVPEQRGQAGDLQRKHQAVGGGG